MKKSVKVLIEKNADINQVIDKGIQIERNPLLMSFMCIANLSTPNLNTMKLLIYKGANPNPLFENGEDCLSYISYIGDTDYSAFGQLSLDTRIDVGLLLIEAGSSTQELFYFFMEYEDYSHDNEDDQNVFLNHNDNKLRHQLLDALNVRIEYLEEAKNQLKTANNDEAIQNILKSLNSYDDSIGSFKKECFGINYESYQIMMKFLTSKNDALIDPLKNYYHQLMQKNLNKKLETRLGFLIDARDKLQEVINQGPQVLEY